MSDRVAVVAIGDPESYSTWSGTPRSILDSLRALGRETEALSADDPRPYDKALYGVLGRPLMGHGARGFRQYYGPRKRRLERRVAQHRGANADISYLHTDHMWTPFDGMGKRDFFFRDASFESYSQNQGLTPRLRRYIGSSVRESFRRAGHVFTTSEWARSGIIKEGAHPDQVSVVGTGVGNLIKPHPTKTNYATKATLCVAKVRYHNKGLDLLLDGFALAHYEDPELSLHLVTPEGVVRPQTGVTTYSNLSAADLVKLYHSVSLFAMPARYEPWGLVYLEAQLSGLPVLGSSRCAFPEICAYGQSGFIVNELTPMAVAESLLNAHASPEVLEARGKLGVKHAQNFTWRGTTEAILSVIDA